MSSIGGIPLSCLAIDYVYYGCLSQFNRLLYFSDGSLQYNRVVHPSNTRPFAIKAKLLSTTILQGCILSSLYNALDYSYCVTAYA